MFLVLFEFFIGSGGHLFEFKDLSVRLALFTVVLVIWFFKKVIKREEFAFTKTDLIKPFTFLILFVCLGSWIGIAKGNDQGLIFADTSSWLFLLLVFPLFEIMKDKKAIQRMFQMLGGAMTGVGALTILSLFLFNTRLEVWGGPFYTWIREYVIGKIIYFQSGFYRVTFPSHFLILVYFLIILALLSSLDKLSEKRGLIFLGLLSIATLIIRYARTFWLAAALAFIFLCLSLKIHWKRKAIFALIVIVVILMEAFIIFGLCIREEKGLSLAAAGVESVARPEEEISSLSRLKKILSPAAERVESIVRPREDVSSLMRLNILSPIISRIKKYPIFGSGLGTEVSYFEPLIQGQKTTPHLDWGYLEIWTELGILGLLSYLWFLGGVCWRGWKIARKTNDNYHEKLTLGLLSGLVGLAVAGVTSPYLFYALGIVYILLCAVIFNNFSKEIS